MSVAPKIRIQNTETKLFLTREGKWSRRRGDAGVFVDAVEAISLCVRRGIRKVRFTVTNQQSGAESHAYPFGGDPATRAQRRELRKFIRDQRRLRHARRQLVRRARSLDPTPESQSLSCTPANAVEDSGRKWA